MIPVQVYFWKTGTNLGIMTTLLALLTHYVFVGVQQQGGGYRLAVTSIEVPA